MAQTGVVQVSGRGTNVDFTIDDASPFDDVVTGLRQYLEDNRKLWSKGKITVNAGSRIGSMQQLTEIKQLIENESGLTVTRFWCSPDFLDSSDSTGARTALALKKADPPNNPFPAPPEEPETELAEHFQASLPPPPEAGEKFSLHPNGSAKVNGHTGGTALLESLSMDLDEEEEGLVDPRRDTALLIKTTCRSGEVIKYPGDVVILGDVNPGAEIVAAGDITVYGALRGLAHAGSTGFTKAAIIAHELESPRLQIGPYVGLASNAPPANGKKRRSRWGGPVIAFIKRRSIYVAKFAGRFARYNRGIPYEG